MAKIKDVKEQLDAEAIRALFNKPSGIGNITTGTGEIMFNYNTVTQQTLTQKQIRERHRKMEAQRNLQNEIRAQAEQLKGQLPGKVEVINRTKSTSAAYKCQKIKDVQTETETAIKAMFKLANMGEPFQGVEDAARAWYDQATYANNIGTKL